MEITISWQKIKELVSSKKIRIQFYETEEKYVIFAVDSYIVYKTEIYKNPNNIIGLDTEKELQNKSDFEQNYKSKANRPLLLSPVEADSLFFSNVLEIPDGQQIGYIEWDFNGAVELRKVRPRPKNAQFGDECHLEVWTKPGVLNANPVKIREFGFTKLEGGDGWMGQWYEGIGTGYIPEYCTLRLVYTKGLDLSYRRFYIDIEVIK